MSGAVRRQLQSTICLDSDYANQALPAASRLLFVPNGTGSHPQPGYLNAYRGLLEQGELDGFTSFALQEETAQTGLVDAWDRLVAAAREFQPTMIVVQHLGSAGLKKSDVVRLRADAPTAKLVYYDPDPFGPSKPLPPDAQVLTSQADVTVGCGSSDFPRVFERAGARTFAYAPNAYDPARFGQPWSATTSRDFDVVVVASRNHGRIPWRRMPGWRGRLELVDTLRKRFGSRLALFGRGWGDRSSLGPVPYDDQQLAIRSAWVSANWDYFPGEAHYFSDRLPISMAAGVPHVTTRHPGYDDLFPSSIGLHSAESPEAIVRQVESLLELDQEELLRQGSAAAKFAASHLSQTTSARALLLRANHASPWAV
jgi:hypothetical protein